MQTSNYRIFSDILIFGCGIVLAKVVQFLLMPLYTYYMTVETYGVAELINSLTELFFPIVTFCIYEATFRYAVDEHFDNRIIINVATKVLTLSFLCASIITVIIQKFICYQYTYQFLFILYTLSLKSVAAYYVRGKGLSRVFAISGFINALILALSNVTFIVFLSWGINGYLLSIGIAHICTTIYLVLFGKIYKEFSLKLKISKEDVYILLQYSMPLIWFNILYWVNTIAGRYILLFYTDSETVGIYVAAIKISAVINAMQQAVYAAFQYSASFEYRNANKERYYSKINNTFTTLYCTLGSLMICFTPLLAQITLKKEFDVAEKYLPVIMFGAIINCISSLFGTMYSTYKVTKKQVPVSIIGGILNVLFCVLIIPKYGIIGACIGSFMSNLGQAIYKMLDVTKLCGLQIKWKVIVINFFLLAYQTIIMSGNSDKRNMYCIFLLVLILVCNGYWWREEINNLIKNRKRKIL